MLGKPQDDLIHHWRLCGDRPPEITPDHTREVSEILNVQRLVQAEPLSQHLLYLWSRLDLLDHFGNGIAGSYVEGKESECDYGPD